jgi:hypothetical protein
MPAETVKAHDRERVSFAGISDGDSLASICCEEGMPDERSVRRWARNHGDFGAKYAVARRLGYEKRADELLEIAAIGPTPRTAAGSSTARM